jgi:hypothetical protein
MGAVNLRHAFYIVRISVKYIGKHAQGTKHLSIREFPQQLKRHPQILACIGCSNSCYIHLNIRNEWRYISAYHSTDMWMLVIASTIEASSNDREAIDANPL